MRAILKGIDESKGAPVPEKKTDIEKAKKFLLSCAMTPRLSPAVLEHKADVNYQNLSADDAKKVLTKFETSQSNCSLGIRKLR